MKTRKVWIFAVVLLVLAAGVGIWSYETFFSEKPLRALYLSDDGEENPLVVDLDTGAVFVVTMPDKILDQNGKKITWKDLKKGNVLKIYGDGIMLESYPGQYPGVTKIKVVKEGDPSDTDAYQDVLPRSVAW